MNPNVEILNLYLGRKGHKVATFTAKVSFLLPLGGREVSYEVHLPKMIVVEGVKGPFAELPKRKYKDGQEPVPVYYLNKPLRDLIEDQALEAYEQAVAEKRFDQEQ